MTTETELERRTKTGLGLHRAKGWNKKAEVAASGSSDESQSWT